jgi:hypothetical protein
MFRDEDFIALLDELKGKISAGTLSREERVCLVNLKSKLHILVTQPDCFLLSTDLWDCVSLGYIMQTASAWEGPQSQNSVLN